MNADQIIGLGGLLAGILLFALAGDSEAYLFPRIIAIVIAVLGLAISVSNLKTSISSTAVAEKVWTSWFRIIPVIAMFILYPLAMEAIGFYSASFVVFLGIVWIYAPEPYSAGAALRRIIISATFIVALFVIFFDITLLQLCMLCFL